MTKKLFLALLMLAIFFTTTVCFAGDEQLGGICQSCGRTFFFKVSQFNDYVNAECLYCGAVQNLRMARNRYLHAKQQKDAEDLRDFGEKMRQNIHEGMERKQELDQRMTQEILEHYKPEPTPKQPRGTDWDPIHIKVED